MDVRTSLSNPPLVSSSSDADYFVHDSMGSGDGRFIGQPLNNTNPLRRDTVLIPAYSWLVLRFVTDNRECDFPFPFIDPLSSFLLPSRLHLSHIPVLTPRTAGLWAFHCHLAWHMAAGLLMQFNSLPTIAAQLDVPQDIINQCSG
jgi:hypothetical protein